MARRTPGHRVGTLFVIIGIMAVLGTTFTAGFLSGRHWERVRVIAGLVKPQAGREPTRERAGALRPADQPPMPSMTFYQELTAPLASPPPRPTKAEARPPKPDPPKAETVVTPDPPRVDTPAVVIPESARRGSYTVQVAAYATREQADTLAARLAARGFETDVTETTTQGGVRYRVRVGPYPTKDAAKDVVARLATDAGLSGFVTIR
jgi:cell division protein FtsN